LRRRKQSADELPESLSQTAAIYFSYLWVAQQSHEKEYFHLDPIL